jgi:hypothetical protein
MTLLYIALVDDWELRGNGMGYPRDMQFRPMRELVRIYDNEGIRSTFNAEVMQQLAFRRLQFRYPELGELADEWENEVLRAFSRGHDVQLHTHSQWHGARYEDGRWILPGFWEIIRFDRETAREILLACKTYLEQLLRRSDPTYRCVSHRAGSWSIAPSTFYLELLEELGIEFDISIVGGVRSVTRNVDFDYTGCEERFLPFYPAPGDARRIADGPQPVICVPTNEFTGTLFRSVRHYLNFFRKFRERRDRRAMRQSAVVSISGHTVSNAPDPFQEWADRRPITFFGRVRRKWIEIAKPHYISDIAQLDYDLLRQLMSSIRQRARATGLQQIPIVLENHTKDIRDFSHIARFARDLTKADDVRTITLTELGYKLRAGEFAVRTRRDFVSSLSQAA